MGIELYGRLPLRPFGSKQEICAVQIIGWIKAGVLN
jgi:hypothetical protein